MLAAVSDPHFAQSIPRAHEVEPKGAQCVRDVANARALLLAWGGAYRERGEDPEPRARLVAELIVHDHTADRRASLRIAPPPMKPTPAAAWAATRMGSTLQPRWTAAHP